MYAHVSNAKTTGYWLWCNSRTVLKGFTDDCCSEWIVHPYFSVGVTPPFKLCILQVEKVFFLKIIGRAIEIIK